MEKLYGVHQESIPALEHGREVHEEIEARLRGDETTFRNVESEAVMLWIAEQGIKFDSANVELMVRKSLPGGVLFEARSDLISGDMVYDWKTSAKGWKPGVERTKQQAVAYHWAFEKSNVTFVVVTPDGSIDPRVVEAKESRTKHYIEKVERVIEGMHSGEYPRKPSLMCQYCPVLATCKPGLNGKEPIYAPESH